MSTAAERIDALAAEAEALGRWTGAFDAGVLWEWLRLELGNERALDEWIDHGKVRTKAVALTPVLHVVSGNTPHAAFQSLLRGLLAGCRNHVKVPSGGLPEFEEWVAGLPPVLAERVEVRRTLPDEWLEVEAAVIFGGAGAIRAFRERLGTGVRRIEHGPKLSIGVVLEPTAEAAERLAEDVLRFDQRGCLSVQAIYVKGGEEAVFRFGDLLASELSAWRERHGRLGFSLSDSGAVANAREVAKFREANGDGVKLWESAGSTEWTVLYDRDPRLGAGPLNGFVKLHPLVGDLTREVLGAEADFISTVAVHPFGQGGEELLEKLAPPRICEAGKTQEPTVFWHHDGMPALASLVRWRDLG